MESQPEFMRFCCCFIAVGIARGEMRENILQQTEMLEIFHFPVTAGLINQLGNTSVVVCCTVCVQACLVLC